MTKKTTGRPSQHTPAITQEICQRIALGESLRKICNDEHMPSTTTVQRWLATPDDLYTPFRDQYAQARQQQADYYGDEVLTVALQAVEETQAPADPKTANALVQARRLQIDALKWTAGQLAPKKWGTSHKQTDTTTTRKADHEAELNKARERSRKAQVTAIDGGKASPKQ